ncbi:hypothetical protein [Mycobacterium sp. IDR2000157661]|uniref:hypothetical protein n=1 Tax=Mycobacterium sp. IDR2000157661 TaxID=2867005 RepID=UPI001EEE14FB|nr:hypothetical protein [Mycobacterium sp. IDR2000157661]ULE35285.1 hypothetical protein K3G64_12395 [Mycobacterium sp. IDR2000157661]
MRRLSVVIAAAAILAGCASEPPGDQPPSPTTDVTSEAPSGHGSLAQCLDEQGVPSAPGPGGGPPAGVAPDAWRQAMAACSALAPGPAS